MPSEIDACSGCGHLLQHHRIMDDDTPDIWPCDLCDCNCYSEDLKGVNERGGADGE